MKPHALPPFPDGWYAVAFGTELAPGALITRTFADEEIVVFRTESGDLAAVDAYCPHLGAHMGKGGCVHGETLQCPFHAFRFDTSGQCVSVPYEGDPPPKAIVRTRPILERNGLIMVWHDAEGSGPTFEPPAVEWDEWSPIQHQELRVRSHPQETTENSVDIGHLGVVHGYEGVEMLEAAEIDGAHLTAKYKMGRANPFIPFADVIVTHFRVHVWGLGYSLVEIEVINYGFRFRLFILPQIMDGEFITLRVGLSMDRQTGAGSLPGLLGAAGRRWINPLIQRATLNGVVHDVGQDFEVWENKVYVAPPILAKGDGPIGPYRSYCKQFYPELRKRRRGAGEERSAAE